MRSQGQRDRVVHEAKLAIHLAGERWDEKAARLNKEIERLRATIAMWHELWGAWMVSRCKSSGRE